MVAPALHPPPRLLPLGLLPPPPGHSSPPPPPRPLRALLPSPRGGGEGGYGGTASHRRACQTRAGYLYPAGPRRPRPTPARPTCFRGRLESRPPCSPPTSQTRLLSYAYKRLNVFPHQHTWPPPHFLVFIQQRTETVPVRMGTDSGPLPGSCSRTPMDPSQCSADYETEATEGEE
ncbi:uncharacterized protein [Bos indicus]|uniref:Uncharacterized protein n=1 Tax=Bos indicus TaxID=9915 RepID=A0ABM4QSK7_BOSIN